MNQTKVISLTILKEFNILALQMAEMSYSPPEPMLICGKDTFVMNVVEQQDITTLDPELKLLMKLLADDGGAIRVPSDIGPCTDHQLVLKSEEIQCPIPGTSRDSKDGHRKVVPCPAPARGTHHSPRMLGAMRNCHHVRMFLPGVHVKI